LSAFGSHHNILASAPFIVLVETLAGGKMVPRLRIAKKGKRGTVGTGYGRLVTNVGFFALAVYAAVYGMTYAYRLHWIACVVAGWLSVLHWLGGSINIGGRPPPGAKAVNR
jgi:GPI inositol-deacylase